MRFFVLLSVVVLTLCACNNELTTIGQDLINNSNNINQKDIRLTNTGTIKLDSFPTSSGEKGEIITEMYMGRYADDYSGTTTAYPCFQIIPTSQPNIATKFDLDSVTFHFTFANKIWGDTIYPTLQTFRLYQLAELPELPRTPNNLSDYFYNNSSIAWPAEGTEPLATISFLPKSKNIRNTYFKLPTTDYLLDMFEKMKYKDDIFTPSSSNPLAYYRFLQYFRGLAIKADENNNCLFAIRSLPDSMYMRFHYHEAENNYYYDIKLLTQNPAYNYNQILTTPPDYFSILQQGQEKEVMFSEKDVAVVQGLSGYMVKIVIPNPEILPAYTTVIKAEILIKPRVWRYPTIAMPSTINVFATTNLNEIRDPVYNTVNNAVIGKYMRDPENNENDRYTFDITDYYLRLQNSPGVVGNEQQILLTLPAMTSSYNRMVIKDTPVLRLYFANYRD